MAATKVQNSTTEDEQQVAKIVLEPLQDRLLIARVTGVTRSSASTESTQVPVASDSA